MDRHRAERISEAIREELAELIANEMADPRVNAVSVTEVLLTPDLRQARVRLALPEAGEPALAALQGARGYLRRQLASRLDLFRLPELRFEADSGVPRRRARSLLRKLRKGRPKDAGAAVPGEKNPSL